MIPVTFIPPSLTDRQKDIVNPFPERYTQQFIQGRQGDNYDYRDERNKFVQQGIHHIFIKFNVFPEIGSELVPMGPVTENNKIITKKDALAYGAVYPQNAKVRNKVPQDDSQGFEIVRPGLFECWSELELSTRAGTAKLFLSITTPESQLPDLQTEMTKQEGLLTGSTAVAQMASFKAELPFGRISDIETCFQNVLGPNATVLKTKEPVSNNLLIFKQPENVDFDDWTRNVTADKPSFAIYNNPNEGKFYYVERLTEKTPATYDGSTEDGMLNRRSFSIDALQEIARFANKALPADPVSVLSILSEMTVEGTYGAPDRPNPPPNSTTWRMAAFIDSEIIRGLPSNLNVGRDIAPIHELYRVFTQDRIPQRKTVIKYGNIKKTIRAAERALLKYDKILSDEQITPDMLRGLRLEEEASKLVSLPKKIDKILDINGIVAPEKNDLLELCFDDKFNLLYVVYNGEIKHTGLGWQYNVTGDSATSTITEPEVLQDISPTTFGYMFYSRDMILAARNTKDPMPWSEFIPSFTYPNPCVKPTEIQNQIEKNKRENKKGLSEKDKLFKSESEVQAVVNDFLQITEKSFYNAVNSTLGSCDSASATVLRDAMLIYNTIYGKSSPKKLAIRAATVLRDQLLERKIIEKELAADAETAIQYAANPQRLLREVEAEVNDALYCLFGALGEAIVEQVLDPMGASPAQKKLVRDITDATRPSLKLDKAPTTDFFKVWRQTVYKLLLNYISQLIFSIFQDMLKAALACGAEETDTSKSKKLRSTYGALQINDLVDRKGGIDLIEIANNNGIQKKIENDTGEVINVAPSQQELRQFNKDTSDILMPDETSSLLDRQSSLRTRAIVEEVVYGNSPQKEKTELSVLQNEDSLSAGDTRYATLTITKDSMSAYFGAIGDLLEGLLEEVLEDLSSSDEYCYPENDVEPSFGGVSNEQALEQTRQQVRSILAKVDQLCEVTSSDFDFGFNMDDFEGLLEPPKFYTDFIELIRRLGLLINNAIAEAMSANVQQAALPPPPPPPYTETELWRAISSNPNYTTTEYLRPRATKDKRRNTNNDKELTYKFGGIGRNQKYIELSWNKNNAILEIGNSGTRDQKVKATEKIIAIAKPAATNAPSLEDAYSIKGTLYPVNTRSKNTPLMIANLNSIYTTGQASVQNRLKELQFTLTKNQYGPNVGVWDRTNRDRLVQLSDVDSEFFNFIGLLANSSEHINHSVRGIYLLQDHGSAEVVAEAENRLKAFMSTITQVPFEPNGDPCYETPQEFRARLMAESIQSHLINFFMNTAPLFRAYNGWQTPDTLNLLAAYVYQSIKTEAGKDGVFNFYISEMENFSNVYSKEGEESRGLTDINLKQFGDRYEQLEYYIRQALSEMFKRFAEDPINFLTNNNIFEDPLLREKYHKLSDFFKTGKVVIPGTRTVSKSISIEAPDLYTGQDNPRIPFTLNNFARLEGTTVENIRETTRPLWEEIGVEAFLLSDPDTELARQIFGLELEVDGHSLEALPVAYTEPKTALLLGDNSARQNSLDNVPNTWTKYFDNEEFAKTSFLGYVPIPYILAAYAAYFDKIVNIKEKTKSMKFYAYRRVAAANDAFINAVNPDNLANTIRYFSPFPIKVNGIEFFSFPQIRNALTFAKGMLEKAEAVEAARALIQENLDEADRFFSEAENAVDDGELTDIRKEYREQQELLDFYTEPSGITHRGLLIGGTPGDRSTPYRSGMAKTKRGISKYNLIMEYYRYVHVDDAPTGNRHYVSAYGITADSADGDVLKSGTNKMSFYGDQLKQLNKVYLDDVYGPAWARWFFGAGGEGNAEEIRGQTKNGIISLAKNVFPNITEGEFDNFVGDDIPPPMGSPSQSPFLALRNVLVDFSITYVTGLRGGFYEEDEEVFLMDTVPSNLEPLKRVNTDIGFGDIYSAGSVLSIDKIRGMVSALEDFLRDNDIENWENV